MKYTFDWKEYAKVARQAVAEGCVLLKNENKTLPIKKNETISVFGRTQFEYYKSGTGSGGMVNAPYVVGIIDGLKNCEDLHFNEELMRRYHGFLEDHPFDKGAGWAMEPWCQEEMEITEEIAKEAAGQSDIALVIIGRTAGEDKDNSATEGSYLLTQLEHKMLKNVCHYFKRVAVILNVGNIIDMKWVETYQPQSVLYVWQGGMEGGNGIADVLTGKVNPCGKLSDTIAYDINDYPSTNNFGSETQNIYTEDIFVGYRYFETVAKEKVMYPFGYGLSYTTFENEVQSFTYDNNRITVQVEVKNTGDRLGKEVIQVYVCPPQGKLCKPTRNLIRYGKTRLLESGSSETLTFTFDREELVSYDDGGYTDHKSCYVLEPGNYKVYAGNDVRNAKFAGEYQIHQLEIVQKLTEACAPTVPFERMKLVEDENEKFTTSKERVPLRSIDLQERIMENRPEDREYVGNKGYQLEDVYDHKISIQEFLNQLSDDDLICMTRGEGMCSPKVTPGIAAAFGGVTERLVEFGIPTAGCADGPSGIRMDCGAKAFSLPNGTALACSFNLELVEALYECEGKELRKNQIDTLLGPGINIHRNPLNGRNFEYFSEDPYLTGSMAVMQLKAMHKYGVTGTIKHFAGNNEEVGRHSADSVVSERALREIYLKAFEMAVKEGNAYCIMSTYGSLNGLWTAGNYDLLTTILRKEWGYTGLVMTDWWAKINDEGGQASIQNTKAMVRAQNDVYMVVADSQSNSSSDNTREALDKGVITRGELLRNAENICRVVMKSPAMDRFLDRNKDEWKEYNCPEEQEGTLYEMPSAVVKEEVCLDITGLHTEKESNVQYALKIPTKGQYLLSFQMKSDASELAQMSMTIFMNNQIKDTITISGTEGKWINRELQIEVFVSIDNYLRLYFGQSGIEIGEIKIRKLSETYYQR
ncbi:MAG: glycoside hydrolase family 3 C-terminal domain-containing protein [Lachnospiraceae bacterium]|nr:glycoside hydrolase family 3 C-terminal domain-containing protein [Lachnospiraceae bacterium]